MTNAKDDLQTRWWNLEAQLVERFGKKPDMEAILFLIGVQEFLAISERNSLKNKSRTSCMLRFAVYLHKAATMSWKK